MIITKHGEEESSSQTCSLKSFSVNEKKQDKTKAAPAQDSSTLSGLYLIPVECDIKNMSFVLICTYLFMSVFSFHIITITIFEMHFGSRNILMPSFFNFK